MITVIVAEDHPKIRQSIRSLLDRAEDVTVIGEAADGAEALALINGDIPDVLVVDIYLPTLNGLYLIRQVKHLKISTRVVAISMYTDDSLIQLASRTGAHAFISKWNLAKELLPAIRAVVRGEDLIDATSSDNQPNETSF